MELYRTVNRIEGWLPDDDRDLIDFVLERQERTEPPGDLAELGVYLGKSAVLVGSHTRTGETMTVVDLFGSVPSDSANRVENLREYPALTRAAFEANYKNALGNLPVVVHGVSSSIADHASHGTHRLVHIDASHLYEHVVTDIEVAEKLLRPGGVVVFDDIRSAHTPGVAAAAWGAVAAGRVEPYAITGQKLYGTVGHATGRPWADVVEEWAGGRPHEVQTIAGRRVVRVWSHTPSAARWVPPIAAPVARRIRDIVRPG